MTKRIFKYVITLEMVDDVVKIPMPIDHKILSAVKCPNSNEIWIYALVDPNSEPCTENIYLLGTGHPHDWIDSKAFIGTVILDLPAGYFVLHCFCDLEAHFNDNMYQEIMRMISERIGGIV